MRIKRGLAAFLAALLLTAPAAALAESTEAALPEEPAAAALEPLGEADAPFEPEVGLADDAGDTGLTVVYEDAPVQELEEGEQWLPDSEPASDVRTGYRDFRESC